MASSSSSRHRRPPGTGIITLLTDFGTRDAFVGIMKGVMLGVNPPARLVDLSHEVAPHDVLAAALLLRSAVRFFPRETVHLAVVDPGVGSRRRALAIATRSATLVGPDNGVLLPAAQTLGIRAIHVIDVERLLTKGILSGPVSQTFHGRDVFAPVAAHISAGLPLHTVGPAVDRIVELTIPACRVSDRAIAGEVLYVDRFGNLITNIAAADLDRFSLPDVSVSIAGERIRGLVPAYTTVSKGELLAIIGSWNLLEVAVHGGSAAHRLAARPGTAVRVTAAGQVGEQRKLTHAIVSKSPGN